LWLAMAIERLTTVDFMLPHGRRHKTATPPAAKLALDALTKMMTRHPQCKE
jgi:hypothetical protein